MGHEVSIQPEVLWGLVLITVVGAIWNASSVVLAAINAHARLGLIYVVVNLVSLLLAYVLSDQFGWPGLLGALLVADVLVLIWVLPKTLAPNSNIESSCVTWEWVIGTDMLRPEAKRNLKSDKPLQPTDRQNRITVG